MALFISKVVRSLCLPVSFLIRRLPAPSIVNTWSIQLKTAEERRSFGNSRKAGAVRCLLSLPVILSSVLLMALAGEPTFPPELEREVFETTVFMYPETIPTLRRVAKRVLICKLVSDRRDLFAAELTV